MQYTADVAKRRSDGTKTLLLKIDPQGNHKNFVGWGSNETLNYFSNHNAEHLNKFIFDDDPSFEAMTYTFSGAHHSDYLKTIQFTHDDDETSLEKKIDSYLGLYGFVPVVHIVDTTAYIELTKGENEILDQADKYRLASLSHNHNWNYAPKSKNH